jgi:hypothetical protein
VFDTSTRRPRGQIAENIDKTLVTPLTAKRNENLQDDHQGDQFIEHCRKAHADSHAGRLGQ